MTLPVHNLHSIVQQQQFLDRFTAALVADYRGKGGQIFCGKGCRNCCSLAVNCTFPEAQLLAGQLSEAQLQCVDGHVMRLKELVCGVTELKEYLRRHRQESGGCPLLDASGACSAYAHRPFSCRSLLATRESRWCGADFTVLSTAEKAAFVASLDRSVTAFPLHYLATAQDAGRELEQQALLAMTAQYGFSLYGSMAVLVHLASRRRLAEKVAKSAVAVREILAGSGLDSPLLLQLEEL
jgi:Fe-S-cluster containining protein